MGNRIRTFAIRTLQSILLLSLPLSAIAAQDAMPVDSGASYGSRQVFVLREDDALIGVSWTGRFTELRLGTNERVVTGVAKQAIAVYITNERYLGYSGSKNQWSYENAQVGETFVELQSGDANAVVLTTKRILSFNGRKWTARRRK